MWKSLKMGAELRHRNQIIPYFFRRYVPHCSPDRPGYAKFSVPVLIFRLMAYPQYVFSIPGSEN